MQIEAMPRSCVLRFSVFSRCSTMRAPEAPTGWPSAIAPPSTFSFSSVKVTQGIVEAELFPAVLLVLPRGEAAEHLRGEGFVDFPVVEVVQRRGRGA